MCNRFFAGPCLCGSRNSLIGCWLPGVSISVFVGELKAFPHRAIDASSRLEARHVWYVGGEDLVGFIKPKQTFFQQVLLQKAVWAGVRMGPHIAHKPYRKCPELFHSCLLLHGVDSPAMLLKYRGPGPAPELGSSRHPSWGCGVFISHEYHYLLIFIYRRACAVKHRKHPPHNLDRDSVGNSSAARTPCLGHCFLAEWWFFLWGQAIKNWGTCKCRTTRFVNRDALPTCL